MKKMLNEKKGIIQLALALPVLIAIIVLMVVLFGFLALSGWFLTKNIFMLLGAFLIILGGLGVFKGFPFQTGITMIVIGIIFLLLPVVFSGFAGITLAAVLY